MFFKLRLYNSLPYLFSALKISASTAVIGAIVGEWIGSTYGIGALIIQAMYNFDSAHALRDRDRRLGVLGRVLPGDLVRRTHGRALAGAGRALSMHAVEQARYRVFDAAMHAANRQSTEEPTMT